MESKKIPYFRPNDPEELSLILSNISGQVDFLLGGNYESHLPKEGTTMIDLQGLGLDSVNSQNRLLRIGGLVTLEQLRECLTDIQDIQDAFSIETGLNVRNSISVFNFIKCADGRSTLLTSLLALKPIAMLLDKEAPVELVKLLPQLRLDNKLIIKELECERPEAFAFESIGRTPKDRPIVCIAIAKYGEGDITVSCGGWGIEPYVTASSNGMHVIKTGVIQFYSKGTDKWASSEYRQHVAEILFARCLKKMNLVLD